MTLLGCCSACGGTGTDAASPETNGLCWGCRATGHPHDRNTPHEVGADCPDDGMLVAFIADQRRQARLAIARMAADFAMSYGWDFYLRWHADYQERRFANFRSRYALGLAIGMPVIDPSTSSKILTSGVTGI